jgi:uncharacterized protein (TIGR02996 family)
VNPQTTIESDESALWGAIEAAPADDAPWLVYADWLDDHERDREAANIRRFLPEVREAVQAGCERWAIMAMVVRQEPTGPGWGHYIRPEPGPSPREVVLHPADNPPPSGSVGNLVLVWVGFAVFLAVTRVGYESVRQRAQEPPPRAEALFPPMFKSDEVAGYTFRLVHDRDVLVLALAADGQATVDIGFKDRRVVRLAGRWVITFDGVLIVFRLEGGPIARLAKVRAEGDRFEVTRFGEKDIFTRERLPAAKP